VAERIPVHALDAMRGDADPLVRELVEERISAAHSCLEGEHAVIEMKPAQREARRR
jgi:hypothetical protein